MSRKYPKARRATALTLLTSTFLVLAAAIAVALHSSPAAAGSTIATPPPVSSRRPMPGDPNTPDEGSGSGSTIVPTSSRSISPTRSLYVWVKGFAYHFFLPSR